MSKFDELLYRLENGLDKEAEGRSPTKSLQDSFLSGLGTAAGGIAVYMGAKGVAGVHNKLINSPKREKIYGKLTRTDPIISRADKEDIRESYKTMIKYAPSASLDEGMVKTFLRQAATYKGSEFGTIRDLATLEKTHKETATKYLVPKG